MERIAISLVTLSVGVTRVQTPVKLNLSYHSHYGEEGHGWVFFVPWCRSSLVPSVHNPAYTLEPNSSSPIGPDVFPPTHLPSADNLICVWVCISCQGKR